MCDKNELLQMDKEPLIDASAKRELTVISNELELTIEAYEKEIERMRESLEQIRQTQFAINAAIDRVQSRSLKDIFGARLCQFYKQKIIANLEERRKTETL